MAALLFLRDDILDVLDLYEEPYDHKKPVLCIDEKPKQLLREKRRPIPRISTGQARS